MLHTVGMQEKILKVALVHELLTIRGGAERVLRVFAKMFPEAPIYTLLYDEKKMGEWFPRERVRTSKLQEEFPFTLNHHHYLRRSPAAIEEFDFSEFDLVISSSSAFAHGIITNGKPKHLCYVHSPARYLWDRSHDVIERSNRGMVGPLKRAYLERTFHQLREWDAEVAPRPDTLIAASKEVQRRIELYWDRKSDVIYPPIGDEWFTNEITSQRANEPTSNYFLIVSTLADYKRIDLAIEACNRLKLPLKIAGEGAAMDALKKIAGETIEFLGYQTHDQLKELYLHARALIVPGEEDFGLTPLEAMAMGIPVIGFTKGGLKETVTEGDHGAFFSEKTPESLMKILDEFDQKKYSPEKCRMQAEKFRESNFVQKMHSSINTLMSEAS